MEEWKVIKLGDLCIDNKGSYGIAASAVPYSEDLYTYLRITDINDDGTINKSDLKSVSDENAEQYLLQPNDIVFARTGGSTGRNYFYDGSDGIFVYAGFLIKFSIDPNKVNPKYIKYFCLSQEYKNWVYSFNTGSTRGNINAQTYANMPVILPPRSQQDLLVRTLSSLDDKIKLNNKINTNLEQQAQALFKNWFVDFEPFGGKMPDNWKLGTIGDLCSTISKTYKGNDSHVVLINTSDVENGTILNHDSVPNSILKGQFKKSFQKGDILYSEIRPANKHYAFVDIETTSNYIASTKLMVIRPNEGINPHYLYHILTNPDLIQEMQHLAETRSGTFPQITFEGELSTYQIPLLPKEEQDKLGELFEKIDNQIFHNIKENKQLSTIRDTIFPKLMNGEIEVV